MSTHITPAARSRALDLIVRATDQLAEDVVHHYSGSYEDCKARAMEQADREIEDLIVSLVRARRDPPQDPAHLLERLPQATVDAALAEVEREDGHGGEL